MYCSMSLDRLPNNRYSCDKGYWRTAKNINANGYIVLQVKRDRYYSAGNMTTSIAVYSDVFINVTCLPVLYAAPLWLLSIGICRSDWREEHKDWASLESSPLYRWELFQCHKWFSTSADMKKVTYYQYMVLSSVRLFLSATVSDFIFMDDNARLNRIYDLNSVERE